MANSSVFGRRVQNRAVLWRKWEACHACSQLHKRDDVLVDPLKVQYNCTASKTRVVKGRGDPGGVSQSGARTKVGSQ